MNSDSHIDGASVGGVLDVLHRLDHVETAVDKILAMIRSLRNYPCYQREKEKGRGRATTRIEKLGEEEERTEAVAMMKLFIVSVIFLSRLPLIFFLPWYPLRLCRFPSFLPSLPPFPSSSLPASFDPSFSPFCPATSCLPSSLAPYLCKQNSSHQSFPLCTHCTLWRDCQIC